MARQTLPDDVIEALVESLVVFEDLLRRDEVARQWTGPSPLPGYTTGGIAGHVLGLMVGFRTRIESDSGDVPVMPYADWFGPALEPGDGHAALIAMGEDLATGGAAHLADQMQGIRVQLEEALRAADPAKVIPLASVPGAGVPLSDFLRTRFVEVLVHADDIAFGVGLPCPEFPPSAWAQCATVVEETTGIRAFDQESVLVSLRGHGRLR